MRRVTRLQYLSDNKSCTHRLLSAPVRSYWGTTQSCRSVSLPTSPPLPAWSHRWHRPWRKRARPRWSAGRQNALWPAAGHTRCHRTCPTYERRSLFNRTKKRVTFDWSCDAVIDGVTHQAAVLRLLQLRWATLSVQGVEWFDPQIWGVGRTCGVARDAQICREQTGTLKLSVINKTGLQR